MLEWWRFGKKLMGSDRRTSSTVQTFTSRLPAFSFFSIEEISFAFNFLFFSEPPAFHFVSTNIAMKGATVASWFANFSKLTSVVFQVLEGALDSLLSSGFQPGQEFPPEGDIREGEEQGCCGAEAFISFGRGLRVQLDRDRYNGLKKSFRRERERIPRGLGSGALRELS